jgi:hypothetical protein
MKPINRNFCAIISSGLADWARSVPDSPPGGLTMPHSNTSPADDERTVGALDTEYQAAVQAHDAATMDRILADAGSPASSL